jgi:CRP-like cAMP-binding protein
MEMFKTFLKDHLFVSDEDWITIKDRLHVEVYDKNEVLTKLGEVEDRLYFLADGVVRLFYEGESKDITLNFAFPNTFISSYSSFLTKSPSEYILQTLTACEVKYLRRQDLEDLYSTTECGHELGRILTENIFLYMSKRESAFLIKSPTERYLDLFKEQPRLIQEIPQKYLASYIGITPQALSRIRAKLLQEN